MRIVLIVYPRTTVGPNCGECLERVKVQEKLETGRRYSGPVPHLYHHHHHHHHHYPRLSWRHKSQTNVRAAGRRHWGRGRGTENLVNTAKTPENKHVLWLIF